MSDHEENIGSPLLSQKDAEPLDQELPISQKKSDLCINIEDDNLSITDKKTSNHFLIYALLSFSGFTTLLLAFSFRTFLNKTILLLLYEIGFFLCLPILIIFFEAYHYFLQPMYNFFDDLQDKAERADNGN